METKVFKELIGQTFSKVEATKETLIFENDKKICTFLHNQDCCEAVYIDDIVGDIEDLKNSPILIAEEVSNDNEPRKDEDDESYTWTFYKFSTAKGSVTVKWYGVSNGYYSEEVDFEEKIKGE